MMNNVLCITDIATLVSFFTIIGGIATAVAAGVAVFTLGEIKNQRETTYKPDFILEEFSFYVYGYSKDGLSYPSEWSEEDKGYYYTTSVSQPNQRFYLKVHNIGLGAAKYVKASYVLDLENCVKFLESQIDKVIEEQQFEFKRDRQFFSTEKCKLPLSQSMYYINPDNENYQLGHILPAAVIKDFTKLQIPLVYLELISLNLYLMRAIKKVVKKDSTIITFNPIPALTLNLSYNDIANKVHTKQFKLVFDLLIGSAKQPTGKFEITETTPNPEN